MHAIAGLLLCTNTIYSHSTPNENFAQAFAELKKAQLIPACGKGIQILPIHLLPYL